MAFATIDLHSAVASHWDAVVLGAGPAGAVAARQLALAGASVLLVERKHFPRWKVCGACVNPQAISLLKTVGLGPDLQELESIPLRNFHIRAPRCDATLDLSGGIAVSRARFDTMLTQAAIDAGCKFLDGTHATIGPLTSQARNVHLQQGADRAETSAQVILAAAGLGNDCFPHARHRPATIAAGSRVGAGGTIEHAPDFYGRGTIYMAVGRSGYLGLVRQEDDSLNVAAALDRDFLAKLGTPGRAAATVLSEAGFPPISSLADVPWQGTVSLTRRLPSPADERVFHLGDSAGYVEPFTGQGIAWAIASAIVVAPLAMQGIADWRHELTQEWVGRHAQLIGRRQTLCRILARGLRSPLLVRGAVQLLARCPALAAPLISRVNAPVLLEGLSGQRPTNCSSLHPETLHTIQS